MVTFFWQLHNAEDNEGTAKAQWERTEMSHDKTVTTFGNQRHMKVLQQKLHSGYPRGIG